MLAMLLLALSGEPSFDDAAFCRDLEAFTAAATGGEAAFVSLIDTDDTRFAKGVGTRPLAGFGPCARYRFEEGWTVTCDRTAGRPLAEAAEWMAGVVGDCLELPATTLPDSWKAHPTRVFETAAWRVVVDTKNCDRCRGPAEVVIRVIAPRATRALP